MRQRILVTAGAAGIGREIVRAFAVNSAKVFVCDIDAKVSLTTHRWLRPMVLLSTKNRCWKLR